MRGQRLRPRWHMSRSVPGPLLDSSMMQRVLIRSMVCNDQCFPFAGGSSKTSCGGDSTCFATECISILGTSSTFSSLTSTRFSALQGSLQFTPRKLYRISQSYHASSASLWSSKLLAISSCMTKLASLWHMRFWRLVVLLLVPNGLSQISDS